MKPEDLWQNTYTGRAFHPHSPRPEEIHAQDIMRALSQQVRFAGHTSEQWTVLQHSLLVESILSRMGAQPLTRLTGLLHDASEAYLVDVPTPVKRHPLMSGYAHIEDRVAYAIALKYGTIHPLPSAVKVADAAALRFEADRLMPRRPQDWGLPEPPPDLAVGSAWRIEQLLERSKGSCRSLFRRRWQELAEECRLPQPEPDEVL